MNNRQKLVQQQFLDNETEILSRLREVYVQSQKDISDKIANLKFSIGKLQAEYDWLDDTDPEKSKIKTMIQSKIYQKQYQEALKGQVDNILDDLQKNAYTNISDYLDKSYEDGFIGTMFDLQGQGIPLCIPLDQQSMVRAVQLDSKISKGLYTRMGEDVATLKKHITSEVSRGISSGMSYEQVAQLIAFKMTGTKYKDGGALARAMTIARTEGHRIQIQGTMDACERAKEKGADIVKQWDSTMDKKTRKSHQQVDGEIRELEETFSNGLMFPGDPSGGAAEVVNCRCALLQRARCALDEDELEVLKDRASFFGLDKADNFAEFRQNYIEKSSIMSLDETVKISKKKYEINSLSVNSKLVNSKRYHDKFENITEYKAVNESIYQESMRMLEHRDGTPYEDMVLLDARTGKFITGNINSKLEGKTGLTEEQFKKVLSHKGELVIVHNHPNSSRISAKDIITAYKHENISSIVAVGHDGTVHTISNINRKVDIDKLWEDVYNDFVNVYNDKRVATKKATSILYEMNLFKYESW